MPAATPFRIGLFLYPECMPAGLFAFADLMHAANLRAGNALFEPVFVAAHDGPVECAHGQLLTPACLLAGAGLDAVLIPGFWANAPAQIADALKANAAAIEQLAAQPKNVMFWSYCTGICIAAATGRLNGQKAAVTWWLADFVRERFPKAVWQTEQTSVFNVRTATASGVHGYLPIAQEFIESRLSKEYYVDLAKLMVLPRPERTHHAFRTMNLIEQPNRMLRELHRAVEQTPATEATVARLAQELAMTERTLARKVAASTGMAVASYVRRIKLNQVSERLIHTSASASAISDELGFSSDAGMRRMFKELTSLTPGQYRQAFGRS
jgi:transcriptional regulator GlxA family with amidase domain